MEKKLLKAGFVMKEDCRLPAWEYEILRQLIDSEYASINLFIQLNFKESKSDAKKKRVPFAYRLFNRFEKWWFRNSADAFHKVDISNELNQISKIKVQAIKKHSSIELNIEDLSKIKSYQLDLVYQSSMLDDVEYINIPVKYGIWKVQFGSNQTPETNFPGFWEVMENNPLTGSTLQIIFDSAPPLVVYRSLTRTVPFSVLNNFNSLAWKSSSFLPLRLNELYKVGPELFFEKYKQAQSVPGANISLQSKQLQSNLKMISMFLQNSSRYLKYKVQNKLMKKNFNILYLFREFDLKSLDFAEFRKISIPKNNFWADPFLVKKNNEYYIFFEDFSFQNNKGRIAVIKLDKDGNKSDYTVVLDKPYHLSYPFIFELDNDYFMIPETSANRTVEIYKCVNFPYKWEFHMNLMEDILLIDVTLVHHEGKWWLFGNTRNHKSVSANDQLMIYYNDKLFSKNWIPHPQNPVATDVSNCRPAGKIFSMDGKLIRPAQNNASWQYGYGINLNEIERLTEEDYIEKEIMTVIPEKYGFLGLHTLNMEKGIVVIDALLP